MCSVRNTHTHLGILTGVSADELGPGALLGGERVGSAHQLVLGHLGVGLGELQPEGLRDLWIEPDPLSTYSGSFIHPFILREQQSQV